MTKNIRISLFILAPIVLWMISGFFVKDEEVQVFEKAELFSVGITNSQAKIFQPTPPSNLLCLKSESNFRQ